MVHVCYLNRKYVNLTHEMGAADKRRDPKLLVNGCMPQEEREEVCCRFTCNANDGLL